MILEKNSNKTILLAKFIFPEKKEDNKRVSKNAINLQLKDLTMCLLLNLIIN